MLSVSLNKTFHSFIPHWLITTAVTGSDGAMAMTSANGLVGTGFASRYRFQPRAVFKVPLGRCKATTLSSFSLDSNRVTTVDNWSVCP